MINKITVIMGEEKLNGEDFKKYKCISETVADTVNRVYLRNTKNEGKK